MNAGRAVLLLSRSKVAHLATPSDYLAAIRAGFLDLAANRYELPQVGHVATADGTVHVKAAWRRAPRPLIAMKINANYPGNIAHGLPTIQGFIALLDAQRGELLALLDSIEITARRTAAATALAAELLARTGSRTLAIIGCGMQASYHLDALLGVIALTGVRCCDPRDEAAAAFCNYARKLGLAAERVSDARTAAHGADIIVALTTSTEPVLQLADVAPGTFIAGVGADNPTKNELSPGLLAGSRVVVDRLSQAAAMGDLHHAIRAGAMRASDVHAELSDLVCGRAGKRADDTQRFVFDSTGIAAQDLAAAEMIYDRAHADPGHTRIVLEDLPG